MYSESKIQTRIKKYCELKGWIAIKTIKLSEAGYPDLFLFKNGKTIFIEVKAKNGVTSPLQLLRHKQLIAQGFKCLVVDNFEQFKTNETEI